MNFLLTIKLVFLILFIYLTSTTYAQKNGLSGAIKEQLISANDCVTLAYDMTLNQLNADEVFKDCIERRAILIGMQKRYGPGKYGKIDAYDIIEGYSHLTDSDNPLVKKEADRFSTAAGSETPDIELKSE
ncbi:MAG: hypothetical protein QM479_02915 [Pseudomonadota bacterium]